MGDLLDNKVIDSFMKDAARIAKDREACFYILELETAEAICDFLGDCPASDYLRSIDWHQLTICPITTFKVKCLHQSILDRAADIQL